MEGNFVIDGFVKQRQELESLLMSNPAMEKKVQKLIRKVLLQARRVVSKAAAEKIKTDPMQAYKAVKTAVYRQVLGGSVSIYNKRGKGKFGSYERPRKLQEGQRGGNRRLRSERTWEVQHYKGEYRAFILRFLNQGTQGRAINFAVDPARQRVKRGARGGNLKKYGKTINTGSRGRIAPRNFFAESSHIALQQAAQQLTTLIDELIKTELR